MLRYLKVIIGVLNGYKEPSIEEDPTPEVLRKTFERKEWRNWFKFLNAFEDFHREFFKTPLIAPKSSFVVEMQNGEIKCIDIVFKHQMKRFYAKEFPMKINHQYLKR